MLYSDFSCAGLAGHLQDTDWISEVTGCEEFVVNHSPEIVIVFSMPFSFISLQQSRS